MERIGNFLTKTEQVCDYIPVVSTVTNGAELVTKLALSILEKISNSASNWLKSTSLIGRVSDKPKRECLTLMIPIVNIWKAYTRDHQYVDKEESVSPETSDNEEKFWDPPVKDEGNDSSDEGSDSSVEGSASASMDTERLDDLLEKSEDLKQQVLNYSITMTQAILSKNDVDDSLKFSPSVAQEAQAFKDKGQDQATGWLTIVRRLFSSFV